MIADSFTLDVYCANLNHDEDGELVLDGKRNCSMNLQRSPIQTSYVSRVQSRRNRSGGNALLRLIWMALIPGGMMILSVLKLESHSSETGVLDDCFRGLVLAVLLIRWGTWFAGDRVDSFGGKATLGRMFGFSGFVAALTGAFWFLISLLAEQSLTS